ncbi:MAG TPA: hypothetical protein VGB53_17515 [Rubricoccaceae bacterium]|jgi:hypothetical protein
MFDTPTPRRRADQDVQLRADLTEMEQRLEAARDDAEVQAVLAPAGYGPDVLDALLARVDAAAKAYDARAEAMAAEDRAGAAEDKAFDDCQKDYVAFRQIARARFKGDDAAATALGLGGDMPDALAAFVRQARLSYANAALAPYAERIAVRGYDSKRLNALTADLDALVTASGADTSTDARAIEATTERDGEADALRLDYAEFRDTARPLLRPFPELTRRIGL